MYYISDENFTKFLENLQNNYEVYVPIKNGGGRFYQKYSYRDTSNNITVGEVRTFEPLKSFFLRAREKVADNFKPDIPHTSNKPFAIVGVKACDLKGFKVQDYVFLNHNWPDPFYARLRQENFIISADCTCAIDTCFCLALGLKPFPQEDFDINLSQIENGFVVEIGSLRAEEIVKKCSFLFAEVKESAITQKNQNRKGVISEVEKNIKDNNLPHQENFTGIIEKGYESSIWEDEAKTCVECGACNTICPTCHCFLLYDQKDEKNMARLRLWDSCMIKDYARVAGGANPRPKLWMRLRNRFEKKFDFFPKVADIYACTGCGRCISACPAKIDIRKVLKKLVNNA